MEIFIPIVIILFIFSLISERITNFLKLNLPEVSDKEKILGFIPGGPFRIKSEDEYCEKIRERRIFWLAFLSALAVSFASKANLFSMLRFMEQANQTLWWNGTRESIPGFKETSMEIVAGCILTSLFISLGSKFWHDLLDLLLYTKNLKEKLADSRTYTMETTEQLDEFLLTPEFKLAELALEQHEVRLRQIPGVLSIGSGYLGKGRAKISCLEVHVDNYDTASKIDREVSFRLKSGKAVSVPIKPVVTAGYPKASSLSAGGSVANKDKSMGWGTAGAVVTDRVTREKYILSCFHVLKGKGSWRGLSESKVIVINDGNEEIEVGVLKYGCRTEELDIALAALHEGVGFSNSFLDRCVEVRKVLPMDAIQEIGVRILGGKTGKVMFGYVYNDSWPAKFLYPDDSVWELRDLIVLTRVDKSTNNLRPLTQGGDSGALVLSDDNHIIGMVVGADDAFTYAIKMEKIAKNFDITFT